jgi:hypothetical protein
MPPLRWGPEKVAQVAKELREALSRPPTPEEIAEGERLVALGWENQVKEQAAIEARFGPGSGKTRIMVGPKQTPDPNQTPDAQTNGSTL